MKITIDTAIYEGTAPVGTNVTLSEQAFASEVIRAVQEQLGTVYSDRVELFAQQFVFGPDIFLANTRACRLRLKLKAVLAFHVHEQVHKVEVEPKDTFKCYDRDCKFVDPNSVASTFIEEVHTQMQIAVHEISDGAWAMTRMLESMEHATSVNEIAQTTKS